MFVLKCFLTKFKCFMAIKTRTELPSCEAIDVRNVNFGDIVRPDTKIKAGANLLLLPT